MFSASLSIVFRIGSIDPCDEPCKPPRDPGKISYYNSVVEIHPSARKHGIADEDIEHAVDNAMSIDKQADDTRLYLGPARDAVLLEVVTIVREDGSELAIHAMRMQPKYLSLLEEE